MIDQRTLQLQTVMGPVLATYLVRSGESAVIGRLPFSDICLLHESVSRRHALVTFKDAQWLLADQGSSAGTLLNGVKLRSGEPKPLAQGDLVRVGPWTMRISILGPNDGPAHSISRTLDDSGNAGQRLSKVGGAHGESMSVVGRRLRLLTQCLGRLSAAREESALGPIALEMVMQGASFGRGALVRTTRHQPPSPAHTPPSLASHIAATGPAGLIGSICISVPGASEEIAILCCNRANASDTGPMTFSRSLIHACAQGNATFVLTEGSQPVSSMSIVEMTIHSAICAPVMLGDNLWGLLYLDARAGEQGVQQEAAEFCEAVATALGLTLSSLHRAALELRQTELTAELQAAREVQETIMPPERGSLSQVDYAVRVLPGAVVAGDMFDVIELNSNPGPRHGSPTCEPARIKTAFFMGDVAGHGAGSGMLMAMLQSHLAALLRTTCDLVASVRGANEYLSARISGGRFASLWAGMLEPDGVLRYIDAGHGHWFIRRAEGTTLSPLAMSTRGGIPLGISSDSTYEEGQLQLFRGDRVILYSDGAVEQRNPEGDYFSLERLRALCAVSQSSHEDVSRVFDDLRAFAGQRALEDDATLASIEYK